MGRLLGIGLALGAAMVLLLVLAAFAIPLFLHEESVRNRLEADLTHSLGRQVAIGRLDVSVWSGGLLAHTVQIADDPAFSRQPFLQAQSVGIGLDLLPLLFRRDVHVRSLAVGSPRVQLLRGPTGRWNYASLGSSASKGSPTSAGSGGSRGFPASLTAGHIVITDGTVTVGEAIPGAAAAEQRSFGKVSLEVKDFSSARAFPFTFSAALPSGGTLRAKGTAGPRNGGDVANTPFAVHVEAKHIDPLALGLVASAAGLAGIIDGVTLDAARTGEQLQITRLLVSSPHLTWVKQARRETPGPAAARHTLLDNLRIDEAEVNDGSLTLITPGQHGAPVAYEKIHAKLSGFRPTASSPFTFSGELPGGGSVEGSGTAGPFAESSGAATPWHAHASFRGVQLGTAGLLPPEAGMHGVLSMQAQVESDGRTVAASGTAQVVALQLARNATPSSKPLHVQFAVTKDVEADRGQIQRAVVSTGGVALTIGGTFMAGGSSTLLNLKINGTEMPIDAIESFLPALGIHLPEGSQLRGGTLTAALGVTGAAGSPVVAGPVRLDNTQLAGFDLGAKLGALASLTGGRLGAATSSGTNIRLLSMDLQEADGTVRTDKVNLEVVGVGSATGSGTVGAGGALDYRMLLKLNGLAGGGQATPAANADGGKGASRGVGGGLAGLLGGGGIAGILLSRGIPVDISGTTSHPVFAPNLGGLTRGLGAGASQQGKPGADPLKNALGGLLGH